MEKRSFGEVTFWALDDGPFRLDGGAMYGVVPRVLWEQVSPPDERNRIPMRTRPLLARGPWGRLLVETGLGDTGDGEFRDRFAVAHPRRLGEALARLGLSPADIDYVLFTHLHWDHAGGAVAVRGGRPTPFFPRAVHVVQRAAWEAAFDARSPRAASFHPDRLRPLEASGRLALVGGETEVLPGVRLVPAGGHCEGHAVVLFDTGAGRAVFLGDLVPLASHVRPLWVMAYDLWPVRTVRDKEALLRRAAAEDWLAIVYHDPRETFGRIRRDERGRFVWRPDQAGGTSPGRR